MSHKNLYKENTHFDKLQNKLLIVFLCLAFCSGMHSNFKENNNRIRISIA